jgi:hypothetical protein
METVQNCIFWELFYYTEDLSALHALIERHFIKWDWGSIQCCRQQ